MKKNLVLLFIALSSSIFISQAKAEINSPADQCLYFIEITISKCQMQVYKKNPDGTLVLFNQYSVATVKKEEKNILWVKEL
ncbi:MAG: hypothetical protein NTZ97_03085 [Candidatus Moranbacteria bacterium]|nr:hypothetical protein [Candidatus Moranbacteria bacterium]